MQATLLGLFGVLLFASLLCLLRLRAQAGGPWGAFAPLTALVVLLLMLRPLTAFLKSDLVPMPDGVRDEAQLEEHYRELLENALTTQGENDLKSGVHTLLEERFGIQVKDAQIRVEYNGDGGISALRVTLRGAALLQDPRRVKSELENILKCTVEVR